MDLATVLVSLAPLLVALVLTGMALGEIVRLLLGRRHPLRVLLNVLSGALCLAVVSLAIPLAGALGIVWWALLLGLLLAGAIALVRSRIAVGPAEPLPPRGDARRRGVRRERRRHRRASRPGWIELGLTAVLLVAAIGVGALAG